MRRRSIFCDHLDYDCKATEERSPPQRRRLWPWQFYLAGLLALLVGGCNSTSDPCALLHPVSAIPVDQCPVTEITTELLSQGVDPMNGIKPYHDPKTGKYVGAPRRPERNTDLHIWPLWEGREPTVCTSCVSVCDCKAVSASAPRCGLVLGNADMPSVIIPHDRPSSCGTNYPLPPGTVRCVQGQCVVMPPSGDNTVK